MPEHNQAIAFDTFVENATRTAEDPSTTTASIAAFDVWSWMDDKAGIVLGGLDQNDVNGGENVTKDNGEWIYQNTQYWTPWHNFHFVAVAPMDSANWEYDYNADTIAFTNVNGTEDLLFDYVKVNTDNKTINSTYDAVALQFAHLLSKTKFTFTNGFATNNMYVKVSDIKMTAPKSATFDVKTEKWGPVAEQISIAYGNVANTSYAQKNESAYERFTIPASAAQEYVVTYTITIYRGTVEDYTVTKTSTITGVALEKGKSYNFVAEISPETLNMQEIKFNVVVEEWVPEIPEEVELPYMYDATSNAYVVNNAEGIEIIADKINSGELPSTSNIVLSGDIDLSAGISLFSTEKASNWTPIGTSANPFKGTFDGKGYTISNLVINGGSESYIGLFGVTHDGEIKNVTVENAEVSGYLGVGVVAGQPYTSKYTNITVKGHVEVNGFAYVGGVGGRNAYANWENITVNVDATSYVKAHSVDAEGKAYRTYVGGVVGFNGEGGHHFKNITSNINVQGSTVDVGGLFGIAHYGNQFENCVCNGNVEIYAAAEEADAQQIGGIAGVWHPGGDVVMNKCSFTGTLTANDGYVIDTYKFGNLVCSAYNTTGTGKLFIDGVSYSAAEASKTPVSTADELVAALENGEDVIFMNDIKINPAAMSNAYGKTGINVKNGQTIDGNGYTLNIKGAGGTWDSGINTTGGIIRNITVTGSFRGIFINHTSTHSEKVVLDNVTIGGNGTVYTISCDQGLYQTIEATNCTFNGWTSYAKDAGEAKFVNCNFGEGSGYKYCRPYSNTEFVNCTFCAGYAVDQSQAEVTFTNCKFE